MSDFERKVLALYVGYTGACVAFVAALALWLDVILHYNDYLQGTNLAEEVGFIGGLHKDSPHLVHVGLPVAALVGYITSRVCRRYFDKN